MMEHQSVTETVLSLPDEQLKEWLEMAKLDLEHAANSEPDSEWHQSCFAAVCMIAQELVKRGIKGPDFKPLH